MSLLRRRCRYFDRIDGINRTLVSAEEYEASPSAYYANTALFFAGVLLTWFLDLIIHSWCGNVLA